MFQVFILALKDETNNIAGMIAGSKTGVFKRLRIVANSYYEEMKDTPAFNKNISKLNKSATNEEVIQWVEIFTGHKVQTLKLKENEFHYFQEKELSISNTSDTIEPAIKKRINKKPDMTKYFPKEMIKPAKK